MKRKRNLMIMALVIGAIALALSACYPAIIESTLTVNLDGSGTRTFVADLIKDGEPNPDNPSDEVSGMFTDPGYFPAGLEAAVDYLNDLKPDFVSELEMEELDDRYRVTFSIDFDSIDDLNDKVLTLSNDLDWDEADIAPAVLDIEEDDEEIVYTYTEDVSFLNISILWISNALWDYEPTPGEVAVFSKGHAQDNFNWEKHYNDDSLMQYAMFFTHKNTVGLDDTEEVFGEDSDEIVVVHTVKKESPPEEVEEDEEEEEEDVKKEEESPKTSDSMAIMGLVLGLGGLAGASLILKKKK